MSMGTRDTQVVDAIVVLSCLFFQPQTQDLYETCRRRTTTTRVVPKAALEHCVGVRCAVSTWDPVLVLYRLSGIVGAWVCVLRLRHGGWWQRFTSVL